MCQGSTVFLLRWHEMCALCTPISHQIQSIYSDENSHFTSGHFQKHRSPGWSQETSSLYLALTTIEKPSNQCEKRLQNWGIACLLAVCHIANILISKYNGSCCCPFLSMQNMNANDWFWEVWSVLWFSRAVPPLWVCRSSSPVTICMPEESACAVIHLVTHTHKIGFDDCTWNSQSYWAKRLNETYHQVLWEWIFSYSVELRFTNTTSAFDLNFFCNS